MDDGIVDPNSDLTSTVNDVLLSPKNEKTDANDSTPTSSTDAASSFSGTALIVSEDPISSTSSDVMEKEKLLPGNSQENNDKDTVVSKNLLGNDGDVDLLDMNIADVSAEPIIEDVEDIVQDLENLLGEPEPQHDFPTRRKEKTPIEEKDLLASLDDPLGENTEPNLSKPQTSSTELPEKSQTITEVSENVDKENLMKTDNTSEKCQDVEIPLEVPSETVKEKEINTNCDVGIKLEELEAVTPGQSVDTLETKIKQTEVSAESSENAELYPEINESSVVTSSENESLAEIENKNSPSFILNDASEDVEETEKIKNIDSSMPLPDMEPTEQILEDVHEKQTEEDASQSKTEEMLISYTIDETTLTDQSVEEVTASQSEQLSEVVFDVIKDEDLNPSELENSDNTTEIPTDMGEVISEATSPSNAIIDASACSNEEIGGPEAVTLQTLKPDVEVEGNVTSSSDLSNELEPSNEKVEISEASNEITESDETDQAQVQELFSFESGDQNEANEEKSISTIEEDCEKIFEQEKSEISTADEVFTQQNVPSVEAITTEENPQNDQEQLEEVLNQPEIDSENKCIIEQDSLQKLCSVPSEIESSTKDEETLEAVLEKESETSSENNSTSEQPSLLGNLVTEEPSKIQEVDSEENPDLVSSGNENLTEDRSPEISETVAILDDSITEKEPTNIENTDVENLSINEEIVALELSQEESTEKLSFLLEDQITEEQLNIKGADSESVIIEETTENIEEPSTNVVEHQDDTPLEIEQEKLESSPTKTEIEEQTIQKEVESISETHDDTLVTDEEVVETFAEKKLDSFNEDTIETAEASSDENHSEVTLIEEQEPTKSEELTEETVEEIVEQIQSSLTETQIEEVQEDTSDKKSDVCEPSEEKEPENIVSHILEIQSTQEIPMEDPEVIDTIEQKQENVDQVSIECISDSVILPEEDDVEMVEEDKKIESIEPMNKSVEEPCSILTLKAEKSTTEHTTSDLPEVNQLDDLKPNVADNVISIENIEEFINDNTEPTESAVDQTTDSSLKSSTDNLVPVEEELCVKKVIIYEHDCHSHQNEDKSENDAAVLSTHVPKEIQEKESEEPLVVRAEEGKQSEDILVARAEEGKQFEDPLVVRAEEGKQSEDLLVARAEEEKESEDPLVVRAEEEKESEDSLALGAGESRSTVSDDLDRKQVETEKSTICQDVEPPHSDYLKVEEDAAVIEAEFDLQEQIVHEDIIESNQTEEVSSSDQHTHQEIPETAEKTNENVDHNVEPTIEDQTSAAVQSILDNMLTEERNRDRVIEKEEPQVVHSSYSSYEVQKAVQEIQGINLTESIVEMSPEEIECISSSEKLCESEKAELEGKHVMVLNVEDQKEVEPDKDGSEAINETTISKPDSIQTIETTEYVGPEKVFEDKVETMHESPNSPLSNTENQDSVTHTPNDIQDVEDADTRITEQQIKSAEKISSGPREQDPIVVPSIDLSEESSSEDASDEDRTHNVVSSSVQSNFFAKESHADSDHKDIKAAASRTVSSKADKVSSNSQFKNEPKKFSPRETRHSSRISEKMKPHSLRDDIDQPLSVNIDEIEREKPYSPKITIKPIKEDEPNEDKEEHKGSLKITITKQSDNTHSILKMCSPDVDHRQKQTDSEESNVVPKLVIKTSDTHSEQNSPKISTRSSKQVLPANSNIRSGSPRITIKPIVKPEIRETITSPLKITIKPIGKPEEFSRQQQRHSPKQSKNKNDDDHYSTRSKVTKTSEGSDVHSPKVTIKPVKPPEESEVVSTPKITIKPIEKPEEARVSPKITIKPVVRPVEVDPDVEDEVKERIVLKINKGNLPAKDTERIGRESRKRELEDDKSEKLAKIKLKFSKDGDAHIVHKRNDSPSHKRQHDFEIERSKKFKPDVTTTDSDDDVKLIENTQSPIVISEDSQSQDSVILIEEAKDPLALVPTPEPITPVTPVSAPRKRGRPRKVPLVVREDFGNDMKDRIVQPTTPISVSSTEQLAETETSGRPKRSCRAQSVRDTLGIKPRKPSKPRGGKRGAGAKSISLKTDKDPGLSEAAKIEVTARSSLTEEALQDARSSQILKVEEAKREEPIKPFGLKSLLEAAKDQNIIEVIEIDTPSNSPKCLEKVEEEVVLEEKPLGDIGNQDKDIGSSENIEIKEFEIQKVDVLDLRDDDGCNKDPSEFGGTDAAASDVEMQPPTPVFAPPLSEASAVDINSTTDIAMFEEETRMSADASSRAQTPAKQVVSADVVVEESQSSVQSTATTESVKISRRSRLEVHQEGDGSVFTADQLNEYYWGGNGPFMIQEQVAQFLGIKSFKRKYPGIPRRMVDMQERDYIRENGLASESMCDLGLTAVNSADILDIMYTDFQEKYEEFCRYQRDKQAKDLLNKQKALSLATNQEKSKLDILEQAVQSAAAYNANFNKTRREQRRACMDLQTMNIHYPKGRLKKISMPKIGNYPVAVVPGQFTDYYKEFTPTEINNLPLNTMLYTELHKILPEASDSDSDSSGSDSDDSSSSGSDSNSSCEDNCKMCEKSTITPRKSPVNSSI